MSILGHLLVASMLASPLSFAAKTTLQVASPDKQHNLVIRERPAPDAPGMTRTSFSIAEVNGKIIRPVGWTVLPLIAVKWHKSGKAVMVIQHISRQMVMSLIAPRNGQWQMWDVDQFRSPPDFFHLFNAESTKSSFLCYYTGHDHRQDALDAYRTEVAIPSGKARLLLVKPLKDEDLRIFDPHAGDLAKQAERATSKNTHHIRSLGHDEPDWFVMHLP